MSEMRNKLYESSVVVQARSGVDEQELEELAEGLLDMVQSRYALVALGPSVSFNCRHSRIEVMFNVSAESPADAQTRAAPVSDEVLRHASQFEFQHATTGKAVVDECQELVIA